MADAAMTQWGRWPNHGTLPITNSARSRRANAAGDAGVSRPTPSDRFMAEQHRKTYRPHWVTILTIALVGALVLTAGIRAYAQNDTREHAHELSPDSVQTDPIQIDPIWAAAGAGSYDLYTMQTSAAFRDQGLRCATPLPPALLIAAEPSDCDLGQTVVDPAYADGVVYEIPVVFHIIEPIGGGVALGDAVIHSQIEILNEDFGALSGTPGGSGNDSGLVFFLADVDPLGNETSGIQRYQSDVYFDDPGPERPNPMKRALAWDPKRYLNIYVNGGAGTLGYATLPQLDAGSLQDGVVLRATSVGRNAPGAPYNQGRTATHEVGHYLGLFHTFRQGCGDPEAPFTSGDLIADTTAEAGPHFGCEPAPSQCVDGLAPIHNYMNYSDDVCMESFTVQQINRMRCVIRHYRPQLVRDINGPRAAIDYFVNDLQVQFTDISSDGASSAIASRVWDFGDGNTTTEANPNHLYARAGAYNVTLTVRDGADREHRAVAQVTVGPRPQAAFAAITDGLAVSFADQSSDSDGDIVSWKWDFGDGATSSFQHPRHVYAASGRYRVTLVAGDDGGSTGQTSIDVEVVAGPRAQFSYLAEPASETNAHTLAFRDDSERGDGTIVAWQWDFGDGTTSVEQSPRHSYRQGGIYLVSLTVTDAGGIDARAQQQILVNDHPSAAWEADIIGLTVAFVDQSRDRDGTIVRWQWDFGDGTVTSETNPVHGYHRPGPYTITLTVTDNLGAMAVYRAELNIAMPTSDGDGPGDTNGDDVSGDSGGGGCRAGGSDGMPSWPWALVLLWLALAQEPSRRPGSRRSDSAS